MTLPARLEGPEQPLASLATQCHDNGISASLTKCYVSGLTRFVFRRKAEAEPWRLAVSRKSINLIQCDERNRFIRCVCKCRNIGLVNGPITMSLPC